MEKAGGTRSSREGRLGRGIGETGEGKGLEVV